MIRSRCAGRISAAGGRYFGDLFTRCYSYEANPGPKTRQVELYDSGQEIVLRVEQINLAAADGSKIKKLLALILTTLMRCSVHLDLLSSNIEKCRRSRWLLDNVLLEIYTWQMLPPFLEIAGGDAESVYAIGKLLGFKKKELIDESMDMIYFGYSIDLNVIKDLRFRDLDLHIYVGLIFSRSWRNSSTLTIVILTLQFFVSGKLAIYCPVA